MKLYTKCFFYPIKQWIKTVFFEMSMLCPWKYCKFLGFTRNFFKSVRSYPLYLVEVIKETCNIELNQIEEYFELKD